MRATWPQNQLLERTENSLTSATRFGEFPNPNFSTLVAQVCARAFWSPGERAFGGKAFLATHHSPIHCAPNRQAIAPCKHLLQTWLKPCGSFRSASLPPTPRPKGPTPSISVTTIFYQAPQGARALPPLSNSLQSAAHSCEPLQTPARP